MKTIKIIDLLSKIANGEEVPEKIKYEYLEYELLPERNNYYCSEHMRWFTNEINALGVLNDEVEIIEEDKKIEKIDLSEWAEITYQEDWEMLTKDFNRNCNLFVNKINEIIDYINKNEENK